MSLANSQSDLDFTRLDAKAFAKCPDDSIDYAVMEKTDSAVVVPLDAGWSDVGSWSAMYDISEPNHQGNVLQGDVIAVETTNSMVRSENRLVTLVGVKDIIVVDTPDALLVTQVGHCQDVKKVATFLNDQKRLEAERHVGKAHEDGLTRVINSDKVGVSTAKLAPGQKLTVAPTRNRELVVVRGEVRLGVGEDVKRLREGARMVLTAAIHAEFANKTGKQVELLFLDVTPPTELDGDKILTLKSYA